MRSPGVHITHRRPESSAQQERRRLKKSSSQAPLRLRHRRIPTCRRHGEHRRPRHPLQCGGGVGGREAPGDREGGGGAAEGQGGADQGQVHLALPHRSLLLGSKGLGTTLNVAKPKKGSSVAVFGLGAVGLAAAEGARIAGASRIIGIDLNPSRFEEAKNFGVTEFVNLKDSDKPVQEVIVEMTDGGVDRSIECTGNINAMISAFECVHDGWGVAVLVGVPNKDAVFMTKPINVLNEGHLGEHFSGTTSRGPISHPLSRCT